jgi:hypothetical protein
MYEITYPKTNVSQGQSPEQKHRESIVTSRMRFSPYDEEYNDALPGYTEKAFFYRYFIFVV